MNTAEKFEKLFEPGRIGSIEVKNRFIMAPMGTHSCDAEGCITDPVIDYFVVRAKGGVGMIIVGFSAQKQC